ncbi:SirB1 family protein [Xanthomonas translucens]|uniref:SirB1 family protein n=1 Tax=Xanthomonas campestris pv. translucens TaxID=343 RepID=UPI0037DCE781
MNPTPLSGPPGLDRVALCGQSWAMVDRLTLPSWNTLAALDDDALPLLATALLIARDEYPQLDAEHYDTLAQNHADHLRHEVAMIEPWPLKMAAINRHLFEELGYSGNHDEYYDPRNSYINEVFERRLGNPISLALVQMEVARRLDIPLDGVSFPGHFLVRLPVDDGLLVMDPFNGGRPLAVEELRERARPHLGGETPDDRALLQILDPAPHRAILTRVLRNLHGVYAERDEWDRAARSADRVLKLMPDQPEALRDRGLAYLQMDYVPGARRDLGHYLQLNPEASDVLPIRERLVELSARAQRMH